jgi:PDZ domain-containing protein
MTELSVPNSSASPGFDVAEVSDAPGRRRRRLWWIVAAVLLAAALVAAALLVPLPYYLIQPGSVRQADPLVEVQGAPTFEHPGEVLFTTVYIDQATVGLLIRGALDDAFELRTEEEIYGKEGRDGSRQANQQRMDLSKLVATKVALEYLGYPAELTGSGARVLGVAPGSPSAGVIEPGEVIVEVDGRPVRMPDDIAVALSGRVPGDVVEVVVRGPESGSGTRTESVRLAAAPDEPSRPVLGVSVDVAEPTIDSPVQVQIDSGEVTGPSAGLAWALAVVDRLVEPSLTEGRDVAVTGEILADGSVGPIGGVAQKVAAVKRAGVDLFLYPAATPEEERAEIEAIAGDDLELRAVRTLDEAIDVLHPGGVRPTQP